MLLSGSRQVLIVLAQVRPQHSDHNGFVQSKSIHPRKDVIDTNLFLVSSQSGYWNPEIGGQVAAGIAGQHAVPISRLLRVAMLSWA